MIRTLYSRNFGRFTDMLKKIKKVEQIANVGIPQRVSDGSMSLQGDDDDTIDGARYWNMLYRVYQSVENYSTYISTIIGWIYGTACKYHEGWPHREGRPETRRNTRRSRESMMANSVRSLENDEKIYAIFFIEIVLTGYKNDLPGTEHVRHFASRPKIQTLVRLCEWEK
jgi:hypothetical protein